ncbi:hypothetical protein LTSEWAN_0988 [Salmonella enterica subsp. enterica serovar Wandsworth str. A4-580]|uniref:Uncharacterized protein n=1 Tax=Salmonella enterica subsp. enterica serovar Wandsworth str. A4-580 TaxID=913086 RepID=G5S808_SALET|nr:hypothetical protein LTSEJOH_2230 [Salmonella enterica subsp. enterica serovar Johannesburg str. S5-703]EHD05694.1 hypothetical protein LTSEWAN_0988 [Salmonella enterica subsp. enterica serovar Wandsworth str. A4-580]
MASLLASSLAVQSASKRDRMLSSLFLLSAIIVLCVLV